MAIVHGSLGRGQIGGQPASLVGGAVAAIDLVALGVEHDDVPRPEVVRVPRSTVWPACRIAEVSEVAAQPARSPIVVAGRGPGPFLVAAPRLLVAGGELLGGAVLVGVVASREHRALDVVEEGGGPAVGHRCVQSPMSPAPTRTCAASPGADRGADAEGVGGSDGDGVGDGEADAVTVGDDDGPGVEGVGEAPSPPGPRPDARAAIPASRMRVDANAIPASPICRAGSPPSPDCDGRTGSGSGRVGWSLMRSSA